MAERRGRTVRIGEVLDSVVGAADRGGGLLKARAADLWPQVAGPEISKHTLGMGLRGTTLQVHVDSHAWATQLTLMADDLRTRLNSALGEEAVREIRFTVSRAVGDARVESETQEASRRRYGGEQVQPEELSEAEIERVEQEASSIENEDLREAAIRARTADLKVKKARKRRNEP